MTNSHVENDDFDFHISKILSITERSTNTRWKIDLDVYRNYFVIGFCKNGEATYKFNGKEVVIRKGDLLFFKKGFVRSAYTSPSDPWSFYSVHFDVHFHNELTRNLFERIEPVMHIPYLNRPPSLFAELNLVWSGKCSGFTVKCKSILMDILYSVIKEQDRSVHSTVHYTAIERAINLILTNYKDHHSIDELAGFAALSSSHFRLLFKKITGMTVTQYQNHIRINKAKDLLLSGECNVTEAALSVGFENIYYFSRLFKQLTGEAPSTYMRGFPHFSHYRN